MTRVDVPQWWPRWRRLRDQLATLVITGGGGVVLLTIGMLFIFLVYQVAPLLRPATMGASDGLDWRTAADSELLWLSAGEYGETLFSIDAAGVARFSRGSDGLTLSESAQAKHAPLTALAAAGTGSQGLAIGFADGSVRLLADKYSYDFRDGQRRVTPRLEYPFGKALLTPQRDQAITRLAVSVDAAALAVQYADGQVDLWRLARDDRSRHPVIAVTRLGRWPDTAAIHFGDGGRWLARLSAGGGYQVWTTSSAGAQPLQGRLFPAGESLSASVMLQGDQSLVAASTGSRLTQYLLVDSAAGLQLRAVREFQTSGEPVRALLAEHRRRGFLALTDRSVQWFHATAGQRSLRAPVELATPRVVAISARANTLFMATPNGQLQRWRLANPHPEVSIASLWKKVWYEGYDEPRYVYQSSASGNDYEPKFSVTPLAFGTLKAAFYTMLFAAPLAIGGAIFTAFLMAPGLRRRVKPTIELLEALPTVILGFLAGLWLAPLVEDHLSAVVNLVLFLPASVLLFAVCWSRLPLRWQRAVPDGYQALLLAPAMLAAAWLALALAQPVENLFFGGDAPYWVTVELGLPYDQRNALVVGIAMGFAVIPTVYSIAEDAIYSVPRHLSSGSMALGATPWQTLTGVVLPTASPGVFSALMIGFGRAVGETMIVLMATGNTPIMDVNIFEGMRTMAANIAVEVPEAAVDSTHYRILFLAAFILFVFTFAVNTVAEVVRQRLRARYGALG